MFLSVYMAGNPDTVGILFFQCYKMVIMCYVLIFLRRGEQVCLLVIGTNCRIPVLVSEFALHTIVNSFNVGCSTVVLIRGLFLSLELDFLF